MTAIAFLIVYCALLLAAVFGRPIYGLYGYMFAFYLHPPGNWWGHLLPSFRWAFFAGLLTLIVILFKNKEALKKSFSYRETKLFLAFTIFVAIQSLWAYSPTLHEEYVFLTLKFLALMIILQSTIEDKKDLVRFLWVNVLGASYLAYKGFEVGRFSNLGTPGMENTNQLAQHFTAVMLFAAFYLLAAKKCSGLALTGFILIILNAIILCESRSVIFSMLAAGVFAFFVVPSMVRKKFYLFGVLALLAFSILLGPGLYKKMVTIVGNDEAGVQQDRSAASRLVIIEAQAKMFMLAPVAGHGHRGTYLLSPRFLGDEYLAGSGGVPTARSSHNFIMTLFVDHGLIGASLFLCIVASCLLRVLTVCRNANQGDIELLVLMLGMGAALVGFMVAGLGSNNKKLEIDIWLYALIPLVQALLLFSDGRNDETKANEAQH